MSLPQAKTKKIVARGEVVKYTTRRCKIGAEKM
jgi:hypothetical protein